jgi:hypothetical protein
VKCVPLCTACHLTTEGGPKRLNSFGTNLENFGKLTLGDASKVAPALARLAAVMPPIDSDGDGVSDIAELIAGDSPSVAGDAGKSQFCSDERFGCGARIAVSPPADRLAWLGAGLGVVRLVWGRRRRAAARARRALE